jgi:hypothetical protein
VGSSSSNAYVRRGFVRVSPDDARYFEFDDGTPFVGVGFNESFASTSIAEDKMSSFEANRINFLRVWMSGSSINGSQWSPWSSHHLPSDAYLPGVGLDTANTYDGADVAWRLDNANPCLFADWAQGGIPVEPNTSYTVSATPGCRARRHGVRAWGSSSRAGWPSTAWPAQQRNADHHVDQSTTAGQRTGMSHGRASSGWTTYSPPERRRRGLVDEAGCGAKTRTRSSCCV